MFLPTERIETHAVTSNFVQKFLPDTIVSAPKVVNFESLRNLPAPVQNYFHNALRDGQRRIKSATIHQSGEFSPKRNHWKRFDAIQHVSVEPPEFEWLAKIRMGIGFNVSVRDAYVARKASMNAKFLRWIPVVRQKSSPELISASLQRFLAEAVWFPTALLPGKSLRWDGVDKNHAVARLKDGAIEVFVEFQFNNVGEITGFFCPARNRYLNGKFERRPWTGRLTNYQEHHGMKIPMKAEVKWLLPDGPFPFYKGKIDQIEYDFETGSVSYVPHPRPLVLL